MTAPAASLPTPPADEPAWSIVSIARYLCVPPHVAYEALLPLVRTDGVGRVFTLDEPHRMFDVATGSSGYALADMYLTAEAVEHLLEALPVGPLARAVVDGVPQAATLTWSEIGAMARHVVEHLGGAQ